MMGKVTSVSKSAGTVRDGVQLFRNRRTLATMLREVWKGTYRMSFKTYFLSVLAILYVISPLDFDWIPFIGWIDDGFIIYFLIKRLHKETHRYNRRKAMERKVR